MVERVDSPDEVSFGAWQVTAARPKSLQAKNTIIELRLTLMSLVILDDAGQALDGWPIEQVAFDVYGNRDGCLRLGVDALWIKSMERRPARDLRDQIGLRRATDPAVGAETLPLGTGPSIESTERRAARELGNRRLTRVGGTLIFGSGLIIAAQVVLGTPRGSGDPEITAVLMPLYTAFFLMVSIPPLLVGIAVLRIRRSGQAIGAIIGWLYGGILLTLQLRQSGGSATISLLTVLMAAFLLGALSFSIALVRRES